MVRGRSEEGSLSAFLDEGEVSIMVSRVREESLLSLRTSGAPISSGSGSEGGSGALGSLNAGRLEAVSDICIGNSSVTERQWQVTNHLWGEDASVNYHLLCLEHESNEGDVRLCEWGAVRGR